MDGDIVCEKEAPGDEQARYHLIRDRQTYIIRSNVDNEKTDSLINQFMIQPECSR